MATSEIQYRQIVFKEMEEMVKSEKPIRLFFAPGSATYQQIRMIAAHKNQESREVVSLAVKALFLVLFGGGEK